MQQKLDFGGRSMLRRYERWRRTENQLILDTLDGLYYWFRARNPTVTRLRSLGLNLTNNITPIRMLFLKRAVGLTGELPKIAKSVSIS
jgi:2-octaprenylphenol hydroxylase